MELSATGHRPIGLAAILRFSVVAAAILLSAACTKTADTTNAFADDQPAGTLYNEGLAYLNGGKLSDAVKSFDEVDRQHPYSEWARKALVMSAFASYRRGRYDDTVAAANRYLTLYPGSPDAAYAQFLIGSSYFHQIPDITRDQGATQKAMAALQEIVDRYPDSEYATDAKNKIIVARDQLAGKEMQVGRYYLERREYIAAINRFKFVVTEYQDTREVEEALERLTEANLAMGLAGEAQTAAAILGHNFPDSQWYKDAYKLLQTGGLEPREDKGSWLSKLFGVPPKTG
jgi:outer membrane protein assembly factor BamD